MARFYANENFPLPVVVQLRQLGHDVTTVQETGKGSQQTPDDFVLQMATADRRAVPRPKWAACRVVAWRAGCFGLGDRRCVSTSWTRPMRAPTRVPGVTPRSAAHPGLC
jgi:hypothetical protein